MSENQKKVEGVGEQEPITKEEAIGKISILWNEAAGMGANDSELPIIREILEQVRKGERDPEEAFKTVYGIVNSKQDYH